MHSDLIKWTVKLLLSITETEPEASGSGDEGEEPDHKYIRHMQSTANLKSDYTVLAQSLMEFTTRLNK